MLSRCIILATLLLVALPLTVFGQDDSELPANLKDRGIGIPTSMFGTYIERGQLILYPFWEYYYNPDAEYKPDELGYGLDKDFRSEYRASETLIFLGYGITNRLALEVEAAAISAELNKAPGDPSPMPYEVEESGLGDVQTQLDFYWRPETQRGLGAFAYFETVYPFNKNKPLTGTSDFEFKLGQGVIRGFKWGTMKARAGVEYSLADNKADLGEIAVEYLKRVSNHWRALLAVEGTQDEWELFTEMQYHLIKDRIIVKFNNGFGLTSKANDWAPEYGLMFIF